MVKLKRIDTRLESDGVWARHPDGWSVLVRSSNSPAVTSAVQKAAAERIGELGRTSGGLSSEEFRDVVARVHAKDVLVAWSDIDDEPNCTPEAALRLMTSPELRLFQEFVIESAANQGRYLRAGVEAIEKN